MKCRAQINGTREGALVLRSVLREVTRKHANSRDLPNKILRSSEGILITYNTIPSKVFTSAKSDFYGNKEGVIIIITTIIHLSRL